ncbi:MAG: hypothetical protein IJU16_02300, partial [Clostridia bacterium]|nr:hypothetical protein [Clostridia bacterium]
MKPGKALLSILLTLALLIPPFSGVLVFAGDPTGPQIHFNVSLQQYVLKDSEITVDFSSDAALTKCETRLEGKVIGTDTFVSFSPESQGLTSGVYTLIAEATDENGNTAIKSTSFRVVDSIDARYQLDGNTMIIPETSVTAYAADVLDYNAGYGSTSDGTMQYEISNDPAAEVKQMNDADLQAVRYLNVEGSAGAYSVSGIPYQVFDIDLNGKTDGDIVVSYDGYTKAGERVALKVYNPASGDWDTIGTFVGEGAISGLVDVATYAHDGKITAAAILDYVINGSDTIIWITDPQHYTKFDDLNEYYYAQYQYAADLYQNGKAAYVMNTGDLVDDRPTSDRAAHEWEIASAAMQIVENAGMPNGLVTGNHDVGDYNYP